jgi:hypothetical protein
VTVVSTVAAIAFGHVGLSWAFGPGPYETGDEVFRFEVGDEEYDPKFRAVPTFLVCFAEPESGARGTYKSVTELMADVVAHVENDVKGVPSPQAHPVAAGLGSSCPTDYR